VTEKLYWAHPTRSTFVTRGARAGVFGDRRSIVLPETLFYPEGGGQLGDVGTLEIGGKAYAIGDTQIDDGGTIHHLADDAIDVSAEADVSGVIDLARRRDHSIHHTAQHALSRALLDEAGADTVSARLGATACTIDVQRASIPDGDLHRAEDLVNALATSNVVVRTLFPTPGELAALPLRRQPKVSEGVRVVAIDDFDVSPCGGTHCLRTGELGQLRIVAIEKYKGMSRVTFHAGRRALDDARTKHKTLALVAADLTCGVMDVPQALAKLRADLKSTREKLEAARAEIATLLARGLLDALPPDDGPHVISLLREGDDIAGLRALAGKLTEDPRVVALVASTDAGGDLVVVVQRGARATVDCGALVQSRAKALGGRGGGRPERAEGRFPKGTPLASLHSGS
jgi:alanyl-tRNA synthetase